MTAAYQIWLYDTSGIKKAVFDAVRDITIELLLDGVSSHQIGFDDTDDRVAQFSADWGVVIMRRGDWSGATWQVLYDGFHRTDEHQITEDNLRIFTSYGRSLEDLLKRRFVQYYADTAYTDKSGPTETVMKDFVRQNAGVDATVANGRFRTVATPIGVQADGAQGSTWAGARAHQNLLEVVQELAQFGSVDFAIVRVGGSGVNFEFRTYYPRKGVDRRASGGGNVDAHVFSPAFGNVSTPSLSKTRTEEIGSVTVLGQGEGEARAYIVEEGSTADDSPWNDIELMWDQRNEDDVEGLDAAALAKLDENGPKDQLAFEVVQIEGSKFGRDYNVGDWITARYGTFEKDLRIVAATITVNDGVEKIRLRCEDPDTQPPTTGSFNPLAQLSTGLLAAATLVPVLLESNPLPRLHAIDLVPGVTPALPPAGVRRLFLDELGKPRLVDSDGTVSDPIGEDTGGGAGGAAALQFTVGDGQTVIVEDRHNLIESLPYALTLSSVTVQSVQGDTGSITLTFQTFTPSGAPSYTTIGTVVITGGAAYYDGTLSGWTTALIAGQGIAVYVSGIDAFTEIGVTLKGTKA